MTLAQCNPNLAEAILQMQSCRCHDPAFWSFDRP